MRHPKKLQKKSRNHRVRQVGGSRYQVQSGASGNHYTVVVTEHGGYCNCKWAQYRPATDGRSGCSHVVSVFNFIETEKSRRVSAWADTRQAKRQHRPVSFIGDGLILTSRKV